MSEPISRRRFAAWLAAAGIAWPRLGAAAGESPVFRTRGVVLIPDDLTLADWPDRAARAGLTTIALHHGRSPKVVADFIASEKGQRFLERCRALRLRVEYELHAMGELLPRDLFAKDKGLFRMDEKGERTPDANLCVHSEAALAIVAENALAMAKALRPTTGRYFLWGDDGRPWCRCPACRGLSDSDQALLLENRILETLRGADPDARLAHLAYANTIAPPAKVEPAKGIFLEFAPIERRYDIPLAKADDAANRRHLDSLDANLRVFGTEGAQVLEYWLDVSRFSRWRKPAVKLPFDPDVLSADLETYGSRGIRHITSFAVYIDADYVARHGEPPIGDYGARLARWRPKERAAPKQG
ncbi:MAG: DUF4838 domain-containing protein [Planctomycetes bacterium]|nr:DUF4838 domain-containing protein [Planctomycetota bacterium]